MKFLVWMFVWMLVPFTDAVDMNLSKLGDSGGQRSLVCCSRCGCKELDVT